MGYLIEAGIRFYESRVNQKEVRSQKEGRKKKKKRRAAGRLGRNSFRHNCAEGAARRRRSSPQASVLLTWANRKPNCLVGFLGHCLARDSRGYVNRNLGPQFNTLRLLLLWNFVTTKPLPFYTHLRLYRYTERRNHSALVLWSDF